MKSGDAWKAGAAVVVLIAAAVLIAWNLGLFSGTTEAPRNDRVDRPHPTGGGAAAPGASGAR